MSFDFVEFYKNLVTQITHAQHAAAGPTADADEVRMHDPVELPPNGQLYIVNGLLMSRDKFSNVISVPSMRSQKLVVPHVLGIGWHWTDTLPGSGPVLAHSIIDLPKEGQHVGSWHVAIDGDKIYQSVPFTRGSWHAGGPTAARLKREDDHFILSHDTHVAGANSYLAGIELVNAGEVRHVEGRGWLAWPYGNAAQEAKSGKSAHVTDDQVVEHKNWDGLVRHYQKFSDFQIKATTEVVRAIVDTYSLLRKNCAWSHHVIDPSRRDDPGPMWMNTILPKILDEVFDGK